LNTPGLNGSLPGGPKDSAQALDDSESGGAPTRLPNLLEGEAQESASPRSSAMPTAAAVRGFSLQKNTYSQ
jgi:hypothetical protein